MRGVSAVSRLSLAVCSRYKFSMSRFIRKLLPYATPEDLNKAEVAHERFLAVFYRIRRNIDWGGKTARDKRHRYVSVGTRQTKHAKRHNQ